MLEYVASSAMQLGTIYEGSLDSAFIGDGLTSGTDLICLAPGCYNFPDDTSRFLLLVKSA